MKYLRIIVAIIIVGVILTLFWVVLKNDTPPVQKTIIKPNYATTEAPSVPKDPCKVNPNVEGCQKG